MNKDELQAEYNKISSQAHDLREQAKAEIKQQEAEKVQPLLEEVARVKDEIAKATHQKYDAKLTALVKKGNEFSRQLDLIKIQEAQNLWYPPGTKVYLWQRERTHIWSGCELVKTDKTGVVTVYDGTQVLAKVNSYSMPKQGDIIVMHHKRDGSIGLKFDIISINWKSSQWLAEGETPQDNILTRKEKLQSENEDI